LTLNQHRHVRFEEVTVGANSGVTVSSDANASAVVVLRGSDLNALPKRSWAARVVVAKPFAGPGAGGQGGQIN